MRPGPVPVPVATVGFRARAVLERAGGVARVTARLSRSVYLECGGETLWLGPAGSTLHGRALIAAAPLAVADAGAVAPVLEDAETWSPPPLDPFAPDAMRASARVLVDEIPEIGTPAGFGALLVGQDPPFPLAAVAGAARDLAAACHRGDAEAAARQARALVGCGGGFTPSGDDYVGGALFARALAAPADAAWAEAVAGVVDHARRTTHPISAALLADLAAGHGHAPLHALAAALASRAPEAAAAGHARALVRLGHSSGWDILAGFLGTLAGAPGRPLR